MFCETTREKEKVGRVVSLSIDLQGVSELDRDAVIASYKTRKKILLLSRDALRVRRFYAQFMQFPHSLHFDASASQSKEGLGKNSFGLALPFV